MTEEIHCGLPIHPVSHRLATLALYVTPGYSLKGPHCIAVAFAMWDDGTLRWLSSLDTDGHRNEYMEAVLSAEQRQVLIGRLETILGDLPRPKDLHLDPAMHSANAYLVALADTRGIVLGRTFAEAWTIDNLFIPPPREDAAEFVRLWTALAAAFKATSDATTGRNVVWKLPDVSWVTRKVSSRG